MKKRNPVIALSIAAALLAVLLSVVVAPRLLPDSAGRGTFAAHGHWEVSYKNLGQMIADADAIVVATHLYSQPGRVEDAETGDPLPFTNQYFRAEQVGKSRKGMANHFVVEQTGGEIPGGGILTIDDGGPYQPGSRYLLFLKQQPDGSYYYLPNPQGRFLNEGGKLKAVVKDQATALVHGQTEEEALGRVRRGGR